MMAETRRAYDGPLEMGEDLMSFEIGDTVDMRRIRSTSPSTRDAIFRDA